MSGHTHRALVLPSLSESLQVITQPIPEPLPGTAIIRVIATIVQPNSRAIFSGKFPIPLATPTTPSSACIGRIHTLGSDSTSLQLGSLVFCDNYIQSRDDPSTSILQGYITGHPLEHVWAHGAFAEYARVPLERCFRIDEQMVNQLGYSFAELCFLGAVCIPLAGLLDVDVSAGDVVVIAPATGAFGGSAIAAALSLGAKVVACGRNAEILAKISQSGDVETVVLTGDEKKDLAAVVGKCPERGADVFLDFSPPAAHGSYLAMGVGALRFGGCALLMGGVYGKVELPYWTVMSRNIRVQGRYMFDRWHAEKAIRLFESGRFKVGKAESLEVKKFKMDQAEEMLLTAEEEAGWGRMVVLEP